MTLLDDYNTRRRLEWLSAQQHPRTPWSYRREVLAWVAAAIAVVLLVTT